MHTIVFYYIHIMHTIIYLSSYHNLAANVCSLLIVGLGVRT